MDNMEKLLSLLNTECGELGKIENLDGKALIEYFRDRKNPEYLFGYEEAEKISDDQIIEDAERVMAHDIFGWKFDGEIDYLFNPTAETSRDNEWSWSLFRTIYWQPLARAYALTKDEKYTKEFLHEMHQFQEVWPAEKYIEDHTFEVKTPFPGHAWRTIESGIRIYTTWLPCFEIFRKSPVWTEKDLASFLLGVRNHALFLMGHYSNHDRSSNWLSMEASALYQIGVMFPEFKEAEEWRHVGYQRVMHEIMYCFSDSGIHMEKTPIYHLVAAIAFTQAIELSKKNGIEVPPYAEELLTRAAEYVMSLIKPDLSTPMIGDADRDDLVTRRADTSIYEGMNLSFFPEDLNELRAYYKWMYEITGKEEFLYFATLRKEGKAPEKLSYSYPAEGVFVSRTGWEAEDDYILMHAVQLERGEKSTHSHNDSGHAEVTLYGEDVLVDCGRYIYRSSIWRDWREYFCSALAHNTLYVDNHEMGTVPNVTRVRGVRALLHEASVKDGVHLIDISHNGYAFMDDSVFHRRKLILLPSHAAVIVDYVTGSERDSHDFRVMFNFNGKDVTLEEGRASFVTNKGTPFALTFTSNVEFSSYLLCGSEEPKGGWISYGYPVREPIGQVTYAYNGKAPFISAAIVSKEGHNISASICGDTVVVVDGDVTYRIGKEEIEK